jgi:WD40 repeat protein
MIQFDDQRGHAMPAEGAKNVGCWLPVVLFLAGCSDAGGNNAEVPNEKGAPNRIAIGRQKIQEKEKAVRTDHYGDPLPAGAVARLGTMRLRHNGDVLAAAFSASGKLLASFGGDNELRLWDAANGRELSHRVLSSITAISIWPTSVEFSPDGKMVAVGGGQHIVLCDAEGGAEPRVSRSNRMTSTDWRSRRTASSWRSTARVMPSRCWTRPRARRCAN